MTGTIALNAVSEKSLLKVLEFKVAHEGQFSFNPSAAQQYQNNPQTPPIYNGVTLGFTSDEQLKTVLQVLSLIVTPA